MTSTASKSAQVLWTPAADARESTQLGQFLQVCEQRAGRVFDDYDELWAWSVGDGLESMWAAVWDVFDVAHTQSYDRILAGTVMPDVQWFVGARLNYVDQILRHAPARVDDVAIIARSDSRARVEWSWGQLTHAVAVARDGLVRLGVGPGDVVAAYLPNIPETVAAFLATASLGAIWTSCAPEFGVQAVVDRFAQVQPRVLLAVEGYRYGAKSVDRRDALRAIRTALPSLSTTVLIPYGDAGSRANPSTGIEIWDLPAALAGGVGAAPVATTPVSPDHPLYVLYSSGTTGLPKAIVHGHGGILLEHLKALGLHGDLGPGDRFSWFTTTGWMMWNYLVSGLAVGATVVLFDGDPTGSGPGTLWQLAAEDEVTWLGLGAPYITSCRRAGLRPGADLGLRALRAVGSTGAPLPPEDFVWVYDAVAEHVMLSPISGGTDVCSAFVGGSPMSPVRIGEIPTRYLGAAVASFDESGRAVIGRQGELVVTRPMPSMPVRFWGDVDGSRYRRAYFEQFPGVWRHGDWVTFMPGGGCVITGRSDATLNRGGVRIGTSEIYRIVEGVSGVADSVIVHIEDAGATSVGRLVLLVQLESGAELDDELVASIQSCLRSDLSPRHVPDEIHQIRAVPTTLSGKKLEVPIKQLFLGATAQEVASPDALRDPAALTEVERIAHHRLAEQALRPTDPTT
jgi:acetoacetyl-CoA synthetase